MTSFIAIQNTYHGIEIGLFNDTICVQSQKIHKYYASKDLIPTLELLLSAQKKSLSDYSFIVANQGPSPFSTLRVVISSVNGLSYASGIPLIGIDTLTAMAHENIDQKHPFTGILLNAFNEQVYGAFIANKTIVNIGCYKVDEFLQNISHEIQNQSIGIIGNGGMLYSSMIQSILGNRAIIDQTIEYCTLETVAQLGLKYWHEGLLSYELMPRYMKKAL